MFAKKRIIYIILIILVIACFIFFIRISPYPAGDDPGLHTSLLRYTINNEGVDFYLPFFPQLKNSYDSTRFVTNIFLTAYSKITGIADVFILTVYLAIFCFCLALIFIFFIIDTWLQSKFIALLGVLFLAFAKWYQEGFWEGNYDQYTGLLLLSAFLYFLFLWYQQNQRNNNFIISIFLLLILYKTHQLGFLVALLIFLIICGHLLYKKNKSGYYYAIIMGLIVIFIILYCIVKPGYFAINNTGYFLLDLLSQAEGVPLLSYYLFILGLFYFFFKKKNFFIFTWFGVTFLFAQSYLFELPFYAFRFNLYLMQVIALIYSLGLYILFNIIKQLPLKRIMQIFVTVVLLFLSFRQIEYTYSLGSWITSQDNNPASVILEEDLRAFQWLKENSYSSEVVLAPYKWGYYLPAIAERSVILDEAIGGDERDNRWELAQQAKALYTAESAIEAYYLSQKIGIDYIIWDKSFSRFPNRYPEYKYDQFNDQSKFLKIYDQEGVQIFKVL